MDTMQFREWDRGFNKAFSENLKRVTKHEQTRNRGAELAKGEVQNVRL